MAWTVICSNSIPTHLLATTVLCSTFILDIHLFILFILCHSHLFIHSIHSFFLYPGFPQNSRFSWATVSCFWTKLLFLHEILHHFHFNTNPGLHEIAHLFEKNIFLHEISDEFLHDFAHEYENKYICFISYFTNIKDLNIWTVWCELVSVKKTSISAVFYSWTIIHYYHFL